METEQSMGQIKWEIKNYLKTNENGIQHIRTYGIKQKQL